MYVYDHFLTLAFILGHVLGLFLGFVSIQDIICKASDLFVIRAYLLCSYVLVI